MTLDGIRQIALRERRNGYGTIQSLRLAPPFAIRLEGIAPRERSTAL